MAPVSASELVDESKKSFGKRLYGMLQHPDALSDPAPKGVHIQPQAPYGGVSCMPSEKRSPADIADGDFASVLRDRLHLWDGVKQQPDGSYGGLPRYVSDQTLTQHLVGEIAVAFKVCTKHKKHSAGKARFLALDIDKDAPERLPVVEGVLRGLGVFDAAFVTGGSKPDKAKVIITFRSMIKREIAESAGQGLFNALVSAAPSMFPARPTNGDIELFPKRPGGISDSWGLLRILGRNVARDGQREHPMNFDGSFCDITRLKPLSEARVSSIAHKSPRPKEEFASWIRLLASKDWTKTDFPTSRSVTLKLIAVARYCVDEFGPQDGRMKYHYLLDLIRNHNPTATTSNGDSRNPFERELREQTFWRIALTRGSKHPFAPIVAPGPGMRVYQGLLEHLRDLGIPPSSEFFCDYRTLGDRMGVNASSARNQANTAEKHGHLIRVSRGSANSVNEETGKVIRGTPTRWLLREASESCEEFRTRANAERHEEQQLAA